MAPDDPAAGRGTVAGVTALLALAYASVMVLLGWALSPALGWWAVVVPLLLTAAVLAGWSRRRRSGLGPATPGSNRKFLLLGALALALSVLGAILVVATDAEVSPLLLALLFLGSASMLGAGLVGRLAETRR